MEYTEDRKVQLIREYVHLEERGEDLLEEFDSSYSDERRAALTDAMAQNEVAMDMQVKAIANFAGNVLNAIDMINVFTENGEKKLRRLLN